jgi:hypothetical protein
VFSISTSPSSWLDRDYAGLSNPTDRFSSSPSRRVVRFDDSAWTSAEVEVEGYLKSGLFSAVVHKAKRTGRIGA